MIWALTRNADSHAGSTLWQIKLTQSELAIEGKSNLFRYSLLRETRCHVDLTSVPAEK